MAIERDFDDPFLSPDAFSTASVARALSDLDWIDQLALAGPDAPDFNTLRQINNDSQAAKLNSGLSSPMALYLRDVDRFPLLTALGEKIVFTLRDQSPEKKDRAGNQIHPHSKVGIQNLKESTAFTSSFPKKDAVRVKNLLDESDTLTAIVANANLRLPISVAKLASGTEFIDRVQDGNIGLLRVIEKFDIQKGWRFSTYAYWWIRQGMLRGVQDTASTIRLPVHMREDMTKIFKKINTLQGQSKNSLTLTQIQGILSEDPDISASLLGRVFDVMRMGMQNPVSLDKPLNTESESTLYTLLPDQGVNVQDTGTERAIESEINTELWELLNQNERFVITQRHLSGEYHTLGNIGDMLGLSRERARQIEAEALAKLRKSRVFKERALAAGFGNYDFSHREESKPLEVNGHEVPFVLPEYVQALAQDPVVISSEVRVTKEDKNQIEKDKYFKNLKIVEQARNSTLWKDVPPEIKTGLNLIFTDQTQHLTEKEQQSVQDEIADMVGMPHFDFGSNIDYWLNIFKNNFENHGKTN